jgi:DNA modification methylase
MTKLKTKKLQWHTEQRRVNDLVPFSKNPRTISERELDSLKKSLKKYNLVELPVVDVDGKIAAGHQRILALKLLGRGDEEIEVRVPNRKLSEGEYRSYLLTSNALHASWDFDILREHFDPDMLLSVGFSDIDLSHVFDDALETEDDQFSVEEELKKIKKPTVRPGELYLLGNHRLLCADSCDEKMVKKLVGNERIDLVDVDIPYNINFSYRSGLGGTKHYGGGMDDNKSDKEYEEFVRALMRNSLAVSKENLHLFFWSDERYIGLIQGLYKELGVDSKRVLLWVKGGDNPTPNVAWNKAFEPCTYGVVGRPYLTKNVTRFNEFMNKELGNGARIFDDISDLFQLWLVRRLPGATYDHPTQKPVPLYEKALRRCTRPGDNVMDLCAGSGTLLIACEQMKRRAFVSEVDPVFATLIIKRYEVLTKRKAKRIA